MYVIPYVCGNDYRFVVWVLSKDTYTQIYTHSHTPTHTHSYTRARKCTQKPMPMYWCTAFQDGLFVGCRQMGDIDHRSGCCHLSADGWVDILETQGWMAASLLKTAPCLYYISSSYYVCPRVWDNQPFLYFSRFALQRPWRKICYLILELD